MNRPALPRRELDAHKGDFGRVLLIGGSRGMAGSIALSAIAALRTGSGLVSVATPDCCLETVAGFDPAIMTIAMPDVDGQYFSPAAAEEIQTHLSTCDAIGIGPGMGTGDGQTTLLRAVIEHSQCPVVIDADAINSISTMEVRDRETMLGDRIVLTPHPGELQRLTGVSAEDRDGQIEAAMTLCKQSGCVIVVKGGPTVIVDGRRHHINETGNPGMATAGAGDVLTGMLTSLLGQNMSPSDAAIAAVHFHGAAGDAAAVGMGQAAITSLDIANHIRVDA